MADASIWHTSCIEQNSPRRRLIMKVTVLLRNEHETVKSLFAELKKANGRNQNGKQVLFDEIRREIRLHAQMETEIFYPALASTPSSISGNLVTSAEKEHRAIEELLDSIDVHDKNFDTKTQELFDAVSRHIEMEEEQIFDEARKTLPEYRLEELGLEMEDRRKILERMAA
jgi:hemerythrin-like domain-containing protein